MVVDRGKRSKTLNYVKPVQNINKDLQSFVEISLMQKSFLHINCKTMHMSKESFRLIEDDPNQRNCQSQLKWFLRGYQVPP